MTVRAVYKPAFLVLLGMCSHARAQITPNNVFTYRDAEEARRLARQQCKPLVLHFLPDTQVGKRQFNSFYWGKSSVKEALLKDVIIVAIPTEKYAGLAKRLGIHAAGGYRTVSPYDLSGMDNGAVPTCRSGFV